MKAAWYTEKGPARDVLQIGELPTPTPAPGEVLIRVRASGVNPSDIKGRGGTGATAFPQVVPNQDGSGEIFAVGSPELSSRVGERVWFYESQLGRWNGSAAEFTTLPAYKAVHLPDDVTFEEGACLGVPALTAWRCVFADGSVAGKNVLVSGGAGAVGRYAIQFAKNGGARVIATVGNAESAVAAAAAGADLVLNRHEDDLPAAIAKFTGDGDGRGVDRVVEVAFAANLDLIVKTISPNGVVATYSSDADAEPKIPFWPLVMLHVTVRFVLVYAMPKDAHLEGAKAINTALQANQLTHQIGRILPLESIVEAHEAVERGEMGKTIIIMP
ncbi:NADPH:quinone reductase [Paracoccus liaowanqingii]|uniref:NADPH:quinone reductase n=1 Tax=Paracoccus liaowanqingii TaxID=2560053 RepID=A0A4Z1C7Z7_9RHOB|nr:NADPH:quinone reductase [Paracoccus liaowanqingii]TGN57478.1 NADPH:quinone reductase [Paracoccus liaowanqingii]